jgi:hypothetical protein
MESEKTLTMDLRNALKDLVKNEIEQLPETLQGIEPKERISILCKLLPFVMPKVQAIEYTQGEPNSW